MMVCCLWLTTTHAQNIFNCKDGESSFYSETPIENIDATSSGMNVVLNTSNGNMVFIVPYTSYKFKKALMQEHFNEKYMESDKYPNAMFKGKINEQIILTKDTTMEVTATGVFSCHGVDKTITEKGTLTVLNGTISLKGAFKVALKDYNIEVPKVVVQNIAEVIDVKFSANLFPYKK